MKGQHPESVLIVLMGAIGDVVRGLPLATRIKQTWPTAKITWAVEPISKSLVSAHPAIDSVLVFERSKGLAGYVAFVRSMRAHRYDVVVDLQRHFKSGVTSLLSRGKRRIGYDRGNSRELNWLFNTELVPSQERFSPKIWQFQTFGDQLGLVKQEQLDFGLIPTQPESTKISELFSELLPQSTHRTRAVLLVGSTWESRLWPVEHYQELVRQLHARWGIYSVIIGGKGEREVAQSIVSGIESLVANFAEKTSLRELVSVFSQSALAIGSDSGPMHIATATSIPIISLWGATSPHRSGPVGSEAYMIQSPIGCSPCYKKQCPGLGTLCMTSLPPKAVLAQVERLFDEGTLVQ